MSDNKTLTEVTVAVVNLPHAERLIRRYMCTYRSPYFCFPPHDLLQVAACIREWTGARVVFLDAIAENLDESAVTAFLHKERAAYMVFLLGVESVATDIACADRLRAAMPGLRTLAFGYYATTFPCEILEKSAIDIVLRGDAEASCCACLAALEAGKALDAIAGAAFRGPSGKPKANAPAYLDALDALPMPDYGMATLAHYNEMLLGGPFAAIQTSRGCPHNCSYCTSSIDRRVVYRTVERVVDEMEQVWKQGARVVRFLDDTFTSDRDRVIKICQEILRRRIRVQWSCLSRVDRLDREMLNWMKKAGCVRVAVGVESYAPAVLRVFGKRLDPQEINGQLRLIRQTGMECVIFIMVGGPYESDADFELTRQGLLQAAADLVIISTVAVYGGTELALRFADQIEFQLIPYTSRWRDPVVAAAALERERVLYREFYLRPRIFWRQLRHFLRFPMRTARLVIMYVGFLIAPRRKGDRPDLF